MDPSLKGSFDVNLNKIEREKKKKNIVSFVSQAIVLFFFDKKKYYRSLQKLNYR